jgi:signal peptidase II
MKISGLYLRLFGAAAAVVLLDQIAKQGALGALKDGPIDLIEGVLSLRLTYNPGGAFGLLQGLPGFFLVATILVIGIILIWAHRLEDPRLIVPLGMVLGGGLGNLGDRIFRDTGGRVVDFIDLHVWPVFNLADSSIVVGVLLILVLSARAPRVAETE